MHKTILIGEINKDLNNRIAEVFRNGDYKIEFFDDGLTIIERLLNGDPSALAVIDTALLDKDGIEVYKQILSIPKYQNYPLIVTDSKYAELDRVLSLELGAADIIKKPFSPRELFLRVYNILNHYSKTVFNNESKIKIGNLTIDTDKKKVKIEDEFIRLNPMEFKLLVYLARRLGEPISRMEILKEVWNYDDKVKSRTVDTHIHRIRKKLECLGGILESYRGIGYRLRSNDQ